MLTGPGRQGGTVLARRDSNRLIVLVCPRPPSSARRRLLAKQKVGGLWIMNAAGGEAISLRSRAFLLIKKAVIKNASIRIGRLLITRYIINQAVYCSVILDSAPG